MRFTRLIAAGVAAMLALGCTRGERTATDSAASRDLQLAPAAPLDQYASPQELGYQTAPGPVAPARSVAAARSAPVRTVRRSAGAVYRAPQKVTHSRRDAAIGAGVGAVSGAVIGRNVKGAVIGAVAGGVLGAVVGATVDVDHR